MDFKDTNTPSKTKDDSKKKETKKPRKKDRKERKKAKREQAELTVDVVQESPLFSFKRRKLDDGQKEDERENCKESKEIKSSTKKVKEVHEATNEENPIPSGSPAGANRKKRKKHKKAKLQKETNSTTNNIQKSPAAVEQASQTSKPPNFPTSKERHPFQVDEADHCETPWRAYNDILPILDKIAEACGKERKNLIIYDPYYCDGGIRRKLQSLGCHKVINQNRDFYHDIQTNNIPPHDVLLTNPPYSGDHMESLLQFVSHNYDSHKKLVPFLLLLPHYVYTKPYFQHYFQSDARGTRQNTNNTKQSLFYLVPPNRYAYEPPSWVNADTGSTALARGKTQTAPFPTFWYCRVSSLQLWLSQTFGPSGQRQSHGCLQYANCTTHLPREFKGEFDVTNKRPNPRARKRAAAKKTPVTVVKPQPAGKATTKKKKRY